MIKRIIQLLIPLLSCFLCSCATVGIEKAKYEIIQKEGKFEVRQYQSLIVAETVVESDFTQAGNSAFGRLFNYISGNNRKRETISMTAPVSQKLRSEKIAMTAPVNQQQSEGKYVISFVMPSKYTMESLPEPLDSDIKLVQIPARKMAAIRYSGSWSQDNW